MFEYVASGLAHTRITKKGLKELQAINPNDPVIELINKMISSFNFDHHKISFLFNAYTELGIGETFSKIIAPTTLNNIYSDSGGLQMVTLGHGSTPELKDKIYNTQSRLSTIGMAFDEIPVETNGGKSERNDTNARFFNKKIVHEKATLTGKNLKRQIEIFSQNGNNSCKPMMIIQGNCYDTYQQWTDIVLKEVGHNNWKYIKGISSGAAALGQGTLEDFKRLFYMTHLELPNDFKVNHYHLLGVGSPSRMLPVYSLLKNGSIAKDCLISYDSTTHTSGLSLGTYFYNNNLMNFNQYKDKNFYDVFNDINTNNRNFGFPEIDEDMLFCRISQPALWNDKYGHDTYSEFHTIFSYLLGSIYNFMKCIDQLKDDNVFFEDFCDRKGLLNPLNTYTSCRDLKDFGQWEHLFSKVLRSKSVNSKEDVPSLDSLF